MFGTITTKKTKNAKLLTLFCEECLQHLLDDEQVENPQNPDALRCPVCIQTTHLPGGSSASLPLFFYLSRVQNIRKELEERQKFCKLCRSKTHIANISFYCFRCGQGHCQDCHLKHDALFSNPTQI